MNNDAAFSETEDTKLKQFLTGGRIYSQLAVAIISALVFVLTLAGIIGIYHNVNEAKNLKGLTKLDVSGDLNGQYVQGNAYKFLAKLGYIAQSDAAATHYYYLMYTDAADGEQYVTLVEAPKNADPQVEQVIDGFLNYVGTYTNDPSALYQGAALQDVTARFKNMTSQEAEMFEEGIRTLGLTNEKCLGYTMKIMELPKATDTVGYWFLCIPFGVAMIVSLILFFYGLKLESKREEANRSPYPYQNRKK